MIIKATAPHMKPALKALWKQAFGDPDSYIDAFLDDHIHLGRCILVDAQPVCALYLLPCTVCGQPFAYLYAVATECSRRNRGFCRALMEDTHRYLAESGYAGVILVPATPQLGAYYSRFGYRYFGGILQWEETAAAAPVLAEALSYRQYRTLRQTLIPTAVVDPDDPTWAFLARQGTFYRVGKGICYGFWEEDRWVCPEFLAEPSLAPGLLASLGADAGTFRRPGGDLFAMYLPLRNDAPRPGYLGFALD